MSDDIAPMRAALALARRGLGNVWPNPAVGCVILRDGQVVGRGWTQPGGRPHAETEALARAGEAARGATAYVTLEPCSHWGRTPPCCDALIRAGVARVCVAMGDPDPRVDGRGLARLREAGIEVVTGVLEAEARALNAGFARRITRGLPVVTLKLASTLDGRIATAAGESRWITGAAARREVHALRARHDAILVGSGTVLADDPDLTCRIPGMERVPMLRAVADARLRTPVTARLVTTARAAPSVIVTRPGHRPDALAPYIAAGVEVVTVRVAEGGSGTRAPTPTLPRSAGEGESLPPLQAKRSGGGLGWGPESSPAPSLDPHALLQSLARRGVTRVLCEGGAGLAASLLAADLVDRIAWFHAPSVMGADGRSAIGPLHLAALAAMPRFRRVVARAVGGDLLTEYEREAE